MHDCSSPKWQQGDPVLQIVNWQYLGHLHIHGADVGIHATADAHIVDFQMLAVLPSLSKLTSSKAGRLQGGLMESGGTGRGNMPAKEIAAAACQPFHASFPAFGKLPQTLSLRAVQHPDQRVCRALVCCAFCIWLGNRGGICAVHSSCQHILRARHLNLGAVQFAFLLEPGKGLLHRPM